MCSAVLGGVQRGRARRSWGCSRSKQRHWGRGRLLFPFSPAVLPQDGGAAAAPGLHAAEEEPVCRDHRAAPGQPAGGGRGSAGSLSRPRGLQPGLGFSLCVCVSVALFVLGGSVPAVSKGFLRNALLPGAGCAPGTGPGSGGEELRGRAARGRGRPGPGAKPGPGLVLRGSTGRAGMPGIAWSPCRCPWLRAGPGCWGSVTARLCWSLTEPRVPAPDQVLPFCVSPVVSHPSSQAFPYCRIPFRGKALSLLLHCWSWLEWEETNGMKGMLTDITRAIRNSTAVATLISKRTHLQF